MCFRGFLYVIVSGFFECLPFPFCGLVSDLFYFIFEKKVTANEPLNFLELGHEEVVWG